MRGGVKIFGNSCPQAVGLLPQETSRRFPRSPTQAEDQPVRVWGQPRRSDKTEEIRVSTSAGNAKSQTETVARTLPRAVVCENRCRRDQAWRMPSPGGKYDSRISSFFATGGILRTASHR